jgi:hypothetical protein
MERLALPKVNMLHRWKQERLSQSGPVASSLESRVREVEKNCEIIGGGFKTETGTLRICEYHVFSHGMGTSPDI